MHPFSKIYHVENGPVILPTIICIEPRSILRSESGEVCSDSFGSVQFKQNKSKSSL